MTRRHDLSEGQTWRDTWIGGLFAMAAAVSLIVGFCWWVTAQ
jgi:hypothetical protein